MHYTFLLGDPGLPTPAELRLDRLGVFAGLTVVTNTHHTNRPRHATPCHAVRSNSQRIYATRAVRCQLKRWKLLQPNYYRPDVFPLANR